VTATATPWGYAEDLRARRLPPGPGTSRERVDRNQRERLFGAMVIAVEENGYEKTRVADLLRISGVSRNTFYRQFKNKEDCFLATVDAIVAAGGESVVTAIRKTEGEWDARLATGFAALIDLIAAHPAAARLYYVETYAAGGEAIDKLEGMGDRMEELAIVAMEQSPRHRDMPRDLLRAILRGFRRVIQTRLRSGDEHDLVDEGPELLRWALSYETPPAKLRRPRKPKPLHHLPPADPLDKRDRILDAVMDLMASKGYQALTIADIAQHAAISLTTFYACFESKDAAVVAALRRGADRILDVTEPAYREAPDWARGVGAGLHAVFAYLMLERPFAQFGGVEVHTGSPLIVAVRDQLTSAARRFLTDGYTDHPHVQPVVGEAIMASIDAMLFDQVGRRDRTRLYELAPTATYLALVPFVGIDEACAIANSSR
jgi:AcrR family transcriptional regulator